MIKQFKAGDKVRAIANVHSVFHGRKIISKGGEAILWGDPTCLNFDSWEIYKSCNNWQRDYTMMFELIPQETDNQREARELREQAEALVVKAKVLEAKV